MCLLLRAQAFQNDLARIVRIARDQPCLHPFAQTGLECRIGNQRIALDVVTRHQQEGGAGQDDQEQA